jgi:hypothetical protein
MMEGILRSQRMHLYKLCLQSESEDACQQLDSIGALAAAHFIDLN